MPAAARPLRVVLAHDDDIHGLLKLHRAGVFASASKDGCIHMWGHDGSWLGTCQAGHRDYRKWTTALCRLGDDRWASASRDGTVTVWDDYGLRLSSHSTMWAVRGGKSGQQQQQLWCKPRNQNRVNCMFYCSSQQGTAAGTGGAETAAGCVYLGAPTGFTVCSADQWDGIASQQTSPRDWVYTMQVGIAHQYFISEISSGFINLMGM